MHTSSTGIRLIYGAHALSLEDVAGLSVAELQLAFCDILSVENDAEAYLDGKLVTDREGTFLQNGDRIEFMRTYGFKGGGRYKTEFMQLTGIGEQTWQELVDRGLRFEMFEGQPMLDDPEVEKWNRYLVKNANTSNLNVADFTEPASILLNGTYDDKTNFRISWDRTTGVITYNGKKQPKPLSQTQIEWLDGLVKANGEFRTLASIIGASEKDSVNPTRLRNNLPACINKLIKSEPGKGARLRIELWK